MRLKVGSFFSARPSQAKDWGCQASLPHPARQVAEALALTDFVDCPGRTQKECWIATSQFLTTLGWQERHLPEHHLVLCRACRQRYYEVSCVHSAPLECKVSSSNYPMAACKPNKDFVDSPFLDAPLRKASQVQVNQRAHIKVRGGLANIGLAPQPLLGEAGHQGRSGCLINT